jgi:lysozyme
MSHPINAAGVALIREFEQRRLFAYPDPGSPLARATRRTHRRRWGFESARTILPELPPHVANLSGAPWTVGWGNTHGVGPFTENTPEQAEADFQRHLREFTEDVLSALTRPANENQLAAMVALAFNIGMGWEGDVKPRGARDGFRKSTVLRAHNRGDFAAAARAFHLWNKAGGKEDRGLVRRRAAESALYLRPVRVIVPLQPLQRDRLEAPVFEEIDVDVDLPELLPVDPESSLMRSPIVRASAAGGLAGLGAAAEGARAVADIRYSLGDWLPWALVIVLLVAVGVIVYQRIKQRRGGWA